MSSQKRLGNRRTWIAGAALLVILALSFASRPQPAVSLQPLESAGEHLAVSSLVVRVQPVYSVTESYSGLVVSRRQSPLGFRIGGRLAEVFVDEGERVARHVRRDARCLVLKILANQAKRLAKTWGYA